MPVSACPDARDLQRLLLGQVPRPEAEPLEQHLAECAHCGTTALGLHAEDTLVEAVRVAARQAAVEEPGQEVVDGLIRRLKQLRGPRPNAAEEVTMPIPTDATPDPGDLPPDVTAELYDFLAPPQGPGELGRLGSYRILKVLGAGGMGVVFQGEDPRLKRLVALKAMRPSLAASPTARERFLREAQATAAVEHDHIIPIYEVNEERGVPYLAMPLLQGETLDDRLKREGRLPLAEVLRIGRQAAEGLAAAHERGLIHRDVKPANIWLEGKRQRVKILDFGLARAVGQESQLTQAGLIVGTPAYMAPEQAQSIPVDARCDLFSLGVVLYRMATGVLPFKGNDAMSTLLSLAMDTPKPPCELNAEVPAPLNRLILSLLAKDPAGRPKSAEVVARVLETLERSLAPAATPAPPVVAPASAPTPQPSQTLTQATRTAPPSRKPSPGRGLALGRLRPTRWGTILTGAVAALVLLAVIVIRLPGGEGTVTIETVDPDVEVSVKKDGKEVVILDTKSKQEVTLKAGAYEVEFKKGGEGLKLEARNFVLKRGDKVVVKVTWKPTEPLDPARISREDSVALEGLLAVIKKKSGSDMAFSPDARLLALRNDGSVELWSLDGPEPSQRSKWDVPGHGGLTFSPDGKELAMLDGDGLHLWALSKDGPTERFHAKCNPGHSLPLAYSPDGMLLAVATNKEKTVRLWDLTTSTPKELAPLTAPAESNGRVVFSPDGKLLACAGIDGKARLWSRSGNNFTERGFIVAPDDHLRAVAFSPDGKSLATAGSASIIRLWDITGDKYTQVATLSGHAGAVRNMEYGPDGKWLLSFDDDKRVILWDVPGRREARKWQPPHPQWWAALAPDGRSAAIQFDPGNVYIVGLTGRYRPKASDVQPSDKEGDRRTTSVGLKLVPIRPGALVMGSSPQEIEQLIKERSPWAAFPWEGETHERIRSEGPRHTVRLTRPFLMSAHEVTVSQFRTFVQATGYKTQAEREGTGAMRFDPNASPSWHMDPKTNWSNPGWEQGDEHPVVCVSWEDARAFCEWLTRQEGRTYRLPTEAEWEYACRAGTTTPFSFGESLSSRQANFNGEHPYGRAEKSPSLGKAVRVGSYPANGFGLYDMHGNVWEWCADWYDPAYYGQSPREDPTGPAKGTSRVVRGGCWGNDGMQLRSASRGWKPPSYRATELGFRVVAEADAPLSPLALVTRPAKIEGVKSWTIETRGHRGQVRALAYSADGRRLASAGADGTIRVWDTSSGQLVRALVTGRANVLALGWLSDGKSLASASSDLALQLWDVESGRLVRTTEGKAEIASANWSPDGSAVVAGAGPVVRIVAGKTGEGRTIQGHVNGNSPVAWPPDGTTVAAAGPDGVLRTWEATSGKALKSFDYKGYIQAAAWSPDGKTVAIGGNHNTVTLWDAVSGKQQRASASLMNPVLALAWSPDGKRLAVGCEHPPGGPGKQIHLLGAATAELVRSFGEPNMVSIRAVAWSPDGKTITAAGDDGSMHLWEADTGKLVHELRGYPAPAPLDALAVSPDGHMLATTAFLDSIRLWKLPDGEFLRSIPERSTFVSWSPDSKQLVGSATHNVFLWEAATGKVAKRADGHGRPVVAGLWSADGKSLVTAGDPPEGTLRKWLPEAGDPAHAKQAWDAKLPDGGLPAVVHWSPDGKRIAVASSHLGFYDAGTGKRGRTFEIGPFTAAAWSPDGKALAQATGNRRVRLWDIESGKAGGDLEGHQGPVGALAWSPDGKRLASAGPRDGILTWDPTAGRLLSKIEGAEGKVWSAESPTGITPLARSNASTWICPSTLAWAPDGKTLISATGGILRFWDADSGKPHGLVLPLSDEKSLVLSAAGHYRGPVWIERDLVYVVQTDGGRETLTPEEMAHKYGWKNDPGRVRLGGE